MLRHAIEFHGQFKFAISGVLLISFLLAGCEPSNYEDCKLEAAKAPSDLGVRVAVATCREKFPEKK